MRSSIYLEITFVLFQSKKCEVKFVIIDNVDIQSICKNNIE